jgi:hypothetical protein
MHSRRQIDQAQFMAGRAYQELIDRAEVSGVRSVDLEKTRISGTSFFDPLNDARQKASNRLHQVEGALIERHGQEGLAVTRGVLSSRKSVEMIAREHGASSERDIRSVGWLFRKCLDAVARKFGFANSDYARHRGRTTGPRGQVIEPAEDPGRKATGAELGNPALRQGRPP